MSEARDRRRAERLVRLYPRSWRVRYGEEFVELLIADFADRPRSVRRLLDVLACAARARLATATAAGAATVFLPAAVAVWSQLLIGWQWSDPGSPATRAAMLLMTGGLVALGGWAVVAGTVAAVNLGRGLRRCAAPGRGVGSAVVGVLGCAVLVVGSLHFSHGWPGTGGHRWRGRDLVPGGLASVCWAATLWVSSYWAHPAALAHFPVATVAWMVVSPLATAAAVVGGARAVRALGAGLRADRPARRSGPPAAIAMAVFTCGACCWIVAGSGGRAHLFAVGLIDVAALGLMSLATAVAAGALAR